VPAFRNTLRSLAFLAATLPTAAFAAGALTGVVTNKTTNKPSAGDTVTLIRLVQGMQEANHTTSDAHGRYTLDIADDDVVHLIRVTHQKASYYQPVQPGTKSVNLEVYEVSPKVDGVTTNVLEMHVEATANELHIVEIIQVLNQSEPARTQFGPAGFDFFIPTDARIVRSTAFRDGMPVPATATPVGDPGHYTFLFPIRPGDTKFGVFLSIPYTGSYTFTPRLTNPVSTLAVVLPLSMKLTPGPSTSYTTSHEAPDRQTYVAQNAVPSQPLSFSLSGTGELPADQQQGQQQPPPASADGQPLPETQNTMPGRGLQNPLDPEGTRDPWAKYKYWILGGLALLLAAAAGVLLRKPSPSDRSDAPSSPSVSPQIAPQNQRDLLLQTLKEELFALETDHLQAHISEAEYLQQKAAIETVLRRALNRVTA
jgi:hypothetical protein